MCTKSGRIRRAKEQRLIESIAVRRKTYNTRTTNLETKRGSITGKCTPSVKTTPYSAKSTLGVSVAEYMQYRQRVK